jgi:hypothetical protein
MIDQSENLTNFLCWLVFALPFRHVKMIDQSENLTNFLRWLVFALFRMFFYKIKTRIGIHVWLNILF